MNNRIIFDCTPLRHPIKGVASYISNYLAHLSLPSAYPDSAIWLLTYDPSLLSFELRSRYRVLVLPRLPELLFGFLALPIINLFLQPTLLVKFSETCSLNTLTPTLTICHDLNELIYSYARHRNQARHLYELFLQRLRIFSVKSSRYLAANSSYTAKLVSDHYSISLTKFTVLPCGVDDTFFLGDPLLHHPFPRIKLDSYIFCIYTGDSREQVSLLPELILLLHASGYRPTLVIAGIPNQSTFDYVEAIFASHGLSSSSDFILIPFINRDQRHYLSSLYYYSDYYVELSAHEGFGMQLVEALATGTTCIALDTPAFLETSLHYPIYVNRLTAHDVASAILLHRSSNTTNNPSRTAQRNYIKRHFSWPVVGPRLGSLIESFL